MTEKKKSPYIISTHQTPNESAIQTKIQEVFEIFDHEQNNTVDIREIGTIIRGLGYCPSEAELQGVLRDVEEPHQIGYAHIDRFLPIMLNVIQQRRFLPASPDEVLKAFKVIDKVESSDCEIDAEVFRKLLTEKGDPFTHEEVDELMKVAINPSSGKVAYQVFINHLSYIEDV
ncbi:dynein regulatory complex protein 8 [Lepeophtheirus salmonis]|uniref:dynein regulatory complex protein 8 n=1 Tax=Lepeophtheirus salmonis TaxID=72036 RepID=UPI001AE6024C|nr:dynein regulatory complex protein 8-like [Lepeophtheirus salmonis]